MSYARISFPGCQFSQRMVCFLLGLLLAVFFFSRIKVKVCFCFLTTFLKFILLGICGRKICQKAVHDHIYLKSLGNSFCKVKVLVFLVVGVRLALILK